MFKGKSQKIKACHSVSTMAASDHYNNILV